MPKKKPKGPTKLGAPSTFTNKLGERILALTAEGKTLDQISEAIGVPPRTLDYWLATKEDLLRSVKECRSFADEVIEASLFRRAAGYSHPAIKFFYDKDLGSVIAKKYTEHYPPDTLACKFWLANRNPERWRDVQKMEHSGKVSLEDLVVGDSPEPEGKE